MISSVILVIVGIASFAANNTVNAHIEEAQFEQAKNVMLAVDKIIKRVMFKPHSSGYIQSSFWKMVPQFTETGENLTLTIDLGSQNWTYKIPINIVRIKGGSYIGITTPKNLLGNNCTLLTNPEGSLGRISIYQSDGAWISLDYARVRCIYTGTSEYFNGSVYENFNVIEITMINMTFGIFEPGNQAFITIQNLGINSENRLEVSGNFEIKVSSLDGEETKSLVELGGDPDIPTLINLVFVKVEVSILKGG